MKNKNERFPAMQKHIRKYNSMLQNQARYYFDIGEFEEIIDYFLESGKVKDAENALNYALKLHPDTSVFQLKYAHILIEKDEFKEAKTLLRKLKSIQPEEAEIHFLLGFIEVLEENIEKAEFFFEEFLELTLFDDDAISSVAFVYEQNGHFNYAIDYLLKSSEKTEYILYDLAYCYEQLDKKEESRKYYKLYLEKKPFSSNAWYNFGVICNELGKYDEAIDAYDFAIAIKPDFSSAYFNKAAILSNLNLCEDSINVHKDFLQMEENNIQAITRIAECYRKMGDFKTAMTHFKKALNIDKYYLDALYGVSTVYYFNEDYFEGLNYIIRALKLDNKNADYHFLQAQFLMQIEHVDKAENSIKEAIKYNPQNSKYWLSYVDLYFDTNIENSKSILLDGLNIIPENADLNYVIAAIYFHENDNENAELYLQKALSLNEKLVGSFIDYYPKSFDVSKFVKN